MDQAVGTVRDHAFFVVLMKFQGQGGFGEEAGDRSIRIDGEEWVF